MPTPHSGPNNCCVATAHLSGNVHRRCLSRPADRSLCRRSGRQSMHLLGHTSQHVPCPCLCADAIGPVHRAHQIMHHVGFVIFCRSYHHCLCRCFYSPTSAGCLNNALVTHHHQCPVIAINESQRQRPTQAQIIVVWPPRI